ncbi:hypothetical protein PIB30_018342 [Stylosanthes scabra]|uniref:HMA domain-containing protein n=1 Tax=Stylosanthes scabra TaxID=79078 RepID=A0ABU6Q938_9FABA|nr:hypothetical protein [Stylosanthes scabra]
MEHNGSIFPICVILKVHLECCYACPRRVNRKLRKIKGVMDVKIDREEGLVTVFGYADSAELIKAIKKAVRKTAEIYVQPEEDQPTEPSCTCKEKSSSAKLIPDDTKSTKSKHTKVLCAKHDDDCFNSSACADFGDDDEPLPLSFSDHGAPLGYNNNVACNASYPHYPQNNGGYFFQGTRNPVPRYSNALAGSCNDGNDCISHPPPRSYGRPQEPPYENSYHHHQQQQQYQQQHYQQQHYQQQQQHYQQQQQQVPPPYSYYSDANVCTIF